MHSAHTPGRGAWVSLGASLKASTAATMQVSLKTQPATALQHVTEKTAAQSHAPPLPRRAVATRGAGAEGLLGTARADPPLPRG